MKESPKRYINPFLSDEENEKVNSWNDEKVNFTNNLNDEKLGKPSEYIDKNVELITCYEESGFHDVKDICVDEGVSLDEKIECDTEHSKLSCIPVLDKHDNMIEDDLVTQFSDHEKPLLPLPLEDCYKDDQSVTAIEVLEPCNNGVNVTDQQLPEAQTEDDLLNETKIEENNTSNPDNVKTATVSTPNHHNTGPVAVSHGGDGESSFSMAGPVSGLVTFSGPISSAGSISHRSDGSNTSIRSFAFPILQNEWNSSPVRMAKADTRGSRKHQGWRQALMCCRF